MAISELLNPRTEQEEQLFVRLLNKGKQKEEEEATSLPFSSSTYDTDPEHDESLDADDEDILMEGQCSAATFHGYSLSASDQQNDDEVEVDTEPEQEPSSHDQELRQQKCDRIVHKIKRLTKELGEDIVPARLRDGAIVEAESRATLKTVPEKRILKKTVNQTAATVAFVVLKNLGVPVTLMAVVQALKKGEKSHSLSRSSKRDYSKNQADVLGISKLVTSLETHTKPGPLPSGEESHQKTCQDATLKLVKSLGCPKEVEKLAVAYSSLSERSSLASRHKGTVAASCVFLAARNARSRLTLAKVADQAGVSTCTIRKALKALESLTTHQENLN